MAMQGYLNHFLGNLDIVNSREVSIEYFFVSQYLIHFLISKPSLLDYSLVYPASLKLVVPNFRYANFWRYLSCHFHGNMAQS